MPDRSLYASSTPASTSRSMSACRARLTTVVRASIVYGVRPRRRHRLLQSFLVGRLSEPGPASLQAHIRDPSRVWPNQVMPGMLVHPRPSVDPDHGVNVGQVAAARRRRVGRAGVPRHPGHG